MSVMTFWSEERVEQLRRLAPDHTASQIAAIMGAPTRNVIIGKIFRLKLNLNPDETRGKARPKLIREKPGPKLRETPGRKPTWKPNAGAARFELLIRSDESDPSVMPDYSRPGAPTEPACETVPETAVDIWSLTENACRWPWWDDTVPSSKRLYCGGRTVKGLSWCDHHARRVFA